MPKTAVVILNYNGIKYLKEFLPILIKFTQDAEIIVADNNSSDDSVAYLSQIEGVKTLQLSQNYGYAGGYNEALKLIDADYFVLVNSDIEVSKDWLAPLVDFMEDHSNYKAAQPKILNQKEKSYFEYAGAAGGYVDSLGYPYCRGRIFDVIETDEGQYDDEVDIFWASGACFIIRSSTFHQLNGFDADFFAHMEEIDLCWRIQSHKGKIRFVPQSVVYHVGGGTLNKSNPKKTYLNFRNGMTLLIKNLPIVNLLLVLPVRFLLDIVASIKFLIDNKTLNHTFAIIRAHKDTLIRLPSNLQKRVKTSKIKPKTLLLWKFYVLGKKAFRKF